MTLTNSKVVPIREETQETQSSKKGVDARWGSKLGKSFTPISRYLLHNAHRVKPEGMPNAKGLSPSELLVVIHLFDHQWDERFGYPSLQTIAERMSLSRRQVRDIMKRLEDLALIERLPGPLGGTNRYNLGPLKKRLEEMMDHDVTTNDTNEVKKEEE